MLIKSLLVLLTAFLFLSLFSPLYLGVVFEKDPFINSIQNEDIFEIFKSRRSVRNFKSDPLPQEHIIKILDIARTAPTAGNQQPWKFLVIQDRKKIEILKTASIEATLNRAQQKGESDREKLENLRQRMEKTYDGYLSAPVIIVVLTDAESKYPNYNEKDGILAAGYLLIAARSLGYGTVFTTDSFPEALVKEVFEIPERFKQICVIPVGIPEEWPEAPVKKQLEELIVYEKFTDSVSNNMPVDKKTIKLDKNVLLKYVGDYDYEGKVIIKISYENGRLFMESAGQGKVELFAESENKFFLKVADASVSFISNDEGHIVEMVANQQGQDFRSIKIK